MLIRSRKIAAWALIPALLLIDLVMTTTPANANITKLVVTHRTCGTLTAYLTYDGFSEVIQVFYGVFAVDLTNNGVFSHSGKPILFIKCYGDHRDKHRQFWRLGRALCTDEHQDGKPNAQHHPRYSSADPRPRNELCGSLPYVPVLLRSRVLMIEARVRVIYGDTDQMGVVYYANYFRYFELARSEYFRARGGSYRELELEGRFLPVVEASCSYKGSARYDDLLLIRTQVSELR